MKQASMHFKILCVFMCAHSRTYAHVPSMHVEIRGHFEGVGSLLLHVGPRDQTQVVRPHDKYLYPQWPPRCLI